jgi:hypothetical protein
MAKGMYTPTAFSRT